MKRFSSLFRLLFVTVAVVLDRGYHCLVDVHFENKEGGFFLKHSGAFRPEQQPKIEIEADIDLEGASSIVNGGDSTVLSVDRFTVFPHSHPISVRAAYGPFSTKQTVPARYIVPDPPPAVAAPSSSFVTVLVNSSSSSKEFDGGSRTDLLMQSRRDLEVSAHLVNREIARDSPVLRVLFHVSGGGIDRSLQKYGKRRSVCVVLHVSYAGQPPLTTACQPSFEDGQCMAEIPIPFTWWPPVPGLERVKLQKTPRKSVLVSYYVLEPKTDPPVDNYEDDNRRPHAFSILKYCSSHLQIQPLTKIDTVPLVNARFGYRELKVDDLLFALVPTAPVYFRSKIYVPMYMRSSFATNSRVVAFEIKARAKSGLKILNAHCRDESSSWTVSFAPNARSTAATVTVRLKEAYNRSTPSDATVNDSRIDQRIEELFAWLLEVEQRESGTSDLWNEEAHIVWIVHYYSRVDNATRMMAETTATSTTSTTTSTAATTSLSSHPGNLSKTRNYNQAALAMSPVDGKMWLKSRNKRTEKTKHKIVAKFEIHKDTTQAVLAVSKTWELINTALLTGKQVSQPMKIFVVSQSGKITDITRQSTCHSEDDSVLKVTSSCSSVYVDGSEIRGSSNATILIKYETFTGVASFLVWMPEIAELDISVSDVKLSEIYDWIVPNTTARFGKTKRSSKGYEKSYDEIERKWYENKVPKNINSIQSVDSMGDDDDGNNKNNENGNLRNDKPNSCKLRHQQASVDIFARFKAVNHESGRVSYLINRKTWLKITDLVAHSLRMADPRVAVLNGRTIIGRSVGRTDLQIVSPLSGRILGSKEIRVVNDKVSITKLLVNVVSGLQLNIVPDSSGENIYIAETSITRKLSAQYQEGLLDIEVEFSDGSVTAVSDISASDYSVSVNTFSPDIVAFAPMFTSRHPRVIAIGEGKGNLKVSLLLPDVCRPEARLKDFTLVSTKATVAVDFESVSAGEYGHKSPVFVQNDGGVSTANNNGFFGGDTVFAKDKKGYGAEQSLDLQDIINGIVPSNEMAKESAAVQTHPHSRNKNFYVSVRPHSPSHIPPMEMGMYIILATFSFAIVVFVVSCIVYASKYKPQTINFHDDPVDASYLFGSRNSRGSCKGGYKLLNSDRTEGCTAKQTSRPREPTTTNVHDWVWLGRATLERASGLLVPSISLNERKRRRQSNQIRITENPTYSQQPNPDTDLNSDLENSSGGCRRHHYSREGNTLLEAADTESRCDHNMSYSSEQSPNTRPLVGTRQKCFQPLSVACRVDGNDNDRKDYKPPVPPHQNLLSVHKIVDDAPAADSVKFDEINSDSSNCPKHHYHRRHQAHPHRHHHHHHHRKNKPNCNQIRVSNTNTYIVCKEDHHHQYLPQQQQQQSQQHHHLYQNPQQSYEEQPQCNDKNDFIVNSCENLSEIKRANIVGNPMFSATNPTEEDGVDCSLTIEDLNLEMDYKKIMAYFDNLKESTA